MEKTFEYLPTQVFVEQINIKNVGNCIIEGRTENDTFFYLAIFTELGVSRVCEFGPCVDCLQYEVKGFNFRYYKTDYSDSKCVSAISKFLQSNSYNIKEAKEITFEELQKYCIIDIMRFIKGN